MYDYLQLLKASSRSITADKYIIFSENDELCTRIKICMTRKLDDF